MIVDAHVRIGRGREVHLSADSLVRQMDDLGVERCLVAPDERCTAVANAEGNAVTAAAARQHPDRLLSYAVANPWLGADAIEELRRARDQGSVALAVDPVLQGFDVLDGLIDPLLELVAEWGWPAYVRTGTPPTALPLPLAELALKFHGMAFIMGRSGATDFWIDALPALTRAPNLYADTAYAPWDTVLQAFVAESCVGPGRVIFSSDAPYALPEAELGRMFEWPLPDGARAQVLGGNASRLLGLSTGQDRRDDRE